MFLSSEPLLEGEALGGPGLLCVFVCMRRKGGGVKMGRGS